MNPRLRLVVFLYALLLAVLAIGLGVQAAHAQTLSCPAGGPGGAGGLGGESLGGSATATSPGFATGGDGGDATGGRGGAGGDGTLPICNQNTNGFDPGPGVAGVRAPAAPAPVLLGPVSAPQATAGALGHTGARTDLLVGVAGVLFVVGGVMVFVVQPRRRAAKSFVEEVKSHNALPSPDELWLAHAQTRSGYDPAETHARRMARAQRRQSIIRRPATTDPFPHVDRVVTKLREAERVA